MDGIRIAFFDIDGTLIPMGRGAVPEKTRQALKALHDRGILLFAATGRSPLGLGALEDLPLDGYLAFNGGLCLGQGETLFQRPLEPGDVARLTENAAALGKPLVLATKDRLAANGESEALETYVGFGGLRLEITEEFSQIAGGEPVFQVLAPCGPGEYERLLTGTKNAEIAAWWDRAVDVIPRGGGKGRAVAQVLASYGIDPGEAMAFGDGDNDIPMLRAVGLGVAMGNGSAGAKAAAAAVCGTAEENGIVEFLLRTGLLGRDGAGRDLTPERRL